MMQESNHENTTQANKKGTETVIYEQEDVFTQPLTADEISVAGKLKVYHRRNGTIIIEWKCNEDEILGDHDWALINHAAVCHNNGSESVEISSVKRHVRPISIELIDLRSYRLCKNNILVLIQKDGTTHPALSFANGNTERFVKVLLCYVSVKKSEKDPTLFLVEDKFQASVDSELVNMNLVPEKRWHRHHGFDITHAPQKVMGFLSNMKKDPYTTTLTTLSKVNEFMLHSDSSQGSFFPDTTSQDEVTDLFKSLNPSEDLEPGFDLITKKANLAERPTVTRLDPLTRDEFKEFCDSDGRINNVERLRERIFKGSIHPNLRAELWCYLLGHYSWKSTYIGREQDRKKLEDEYFIMKRQWMTISPAQEQNFMGFRDRKSLIEKDVNRTDRTHPFYEKEDNTNVTLLHNILMTYVMYNFDLGYVQGMSDLLSPILYVTQNEAMAFWCFVGFMDMVSRNFDIDQAGMKDQLKDLHLLVSVIDPEFKSYLEAKDSANLFFCFRWLLVWFKRELCFVDTLRLWEVLWSGYPCPNFHLLIAAAILDTEKNTIVESKFGFTEILKHINDISMRIDLDLTLKKAEAIYLQLKASKSVPNHVRTIIGLPISYTPDEEIAEEAETIITSADANTDGGFMSAVTNILETIDTAVGNLAGDITAEEFESQFEDALSHHFS